MEGVRRVIGRRNTAQFLRALPALLAAALTGCANQIVVVHDEPHVASESVKLVAETSVRGDKILLEVFRERLVLMEQEYWRKHAKGAPPAGLSTAALPATARTAQSVGWDQGDGSSGDSGSGILFIAVIAAVIIVALPIVAVYGIAIGTEYFVERATFDEQRTVISTSRSSRERSDAVTVERADGSGRFPLGPQPESGYLLDAATIDLLGGPGDVVLHDGDLSAPFTLVRPR